MIVVGLLLAFAVSFGVPDTSLVSEERVDCV